MALQSLGSSGKAIAAKDLSVGDVFKGYLVGFIETESQYGTSISPKFKTEEGEEVVLWSSGNLRYLKENIEKNGIPIGTYMEITSVKPPKGKNYKTYFSTSFDPDKVLAVNESGESEY